MYISYMVIAFIYDIYNTSINCDAIVHCHIWPNHNIYLTQLYLYG